MLWDMPDEELFLLRLAGGVLRWLVGDGAFFVGVLEFWGLKLFWFLSGRVLWDESGEGELIPLWL